MRTFFAEGFCAVYIKDTSESPSLSTKWYPISIKLPITSQNQMNLVSEVIAILVSNGTVSTEQKLLYYRDKTQQDCTFSYTSATLSTPPDELLALLKKEEAKDFVLVGTSGEITGLVVIFVKTRNYQYNSMNIDDSYGLYSFSL